MASRFRVVSFLFTALAMGIPLTASARTNVGFSDFNGDGRDDLLWVNGADAGRYISFMEGTTRSSYASVTVQPGAGWDVVGVNDFDRDGKADIVWHEASGATSIWTMAGAGPKAFISLPNTGANWQVEGTGDFDGDGSTDILWRNTSNSEVSIWLMEGTEPRAFTVVSGAPASSWSIAGTGDFNHDGRTDILWTQVQSNGSVSPVIWLMNGNTIASSAQEPVAGAGWHVGGLGDFDGNGTADILWYDGTELSIWLMNGTSPTFTVVNEPVPSGQGIADIGDYDGDGRDDILFLGTAISGGHYIPTSMTSYLMHSDVVESVTTDTPPPAGNDCEWIWHQGSACNVIY